MNGSHAEAQKTQSVGKIAEAIDAAAFEACHALSQVLDAHQTIGRLKEEIEEIMPQADLQSEDGTRVAQFHALIQRVHDALTRAAAFMPENVWMQFVSQSRYVPRLDLEGDDIWGDTPALPAAAFRPGLRDGAARNVLEESRIDLGIAAAAVA